jgi:hypothetical protein
VYLQVTSSLSPGAAARSRLLTETHGTPGATLGGTGVPGASGTLEVAVALAVACSGTVAAVFVGGGVRVCVVVCPLDLPRFAGVDTGNR